MRLWKVRTAQQNVNKFFRTVGWAKARPSRRAHHSFAERTLNILHISSPIDSELASLDKTVKAAVRPIDYPRDVPMLHRIEMDVIDMALEIRFVANRMLPIAALPDALLSFHNLAR